MLSSLTYNLESFVAYSDPGHLSKYLSGSDSGPQLPLTQPSPCKRFHQFCKQDCPESGSSLLHHQLQDKLLFKSMPRLQCLTPGNAEAHQLSVVELGQCCCFSVGLQSQNLPWRATHECILCTLPEREVLGGPGSCPVGPFEEARRPQHKEARSVPCGLGRELQETTLNGAAPTRDKGTAENSKVPPFKCL